MCELTCRHEVPRRSAGARLCLAPSVSGVLEAGSLASFTPWLVLHQGSS